MTWSFIWLAAGIAVAGYFIGDGLKNFKNPDAKNFIDSLDEDDDHELIKLIFAYNNGPRRIPSNSLLIQEHSDIPHVVINSQVYYPKRKLRKWLLDV